MSVGYGVTDGADNHVHAVESCREVALTIIRVTDTDTPDQIAEAIRHLRERQQRCQLASMRAEIGEGIDRLVDLWMAATRVER